MGARPAAPAPPVLGQDPRRSGRSPALPGPKRALRREIFVWVAAAVRRVYTSRSTSSTGVEALLAARASWFKSIAAKSTGVPGGGRRAIMISASSTDRVKILVILGERSPTHEIAAAAPSTEAELIAASDAALEILYLRELLAEMGFRQESPTVLYVDNSGAVELSRDLKSCQRSCHVERRYLKIRELVAAGVIEVRAINTKDNPQPTSSRSRLSIRRPSRATRRL